MSDDNNFEKATEFINQPIQKAVVYKVWFENGIQKIGCYSPIFGKMAFSVDISKGIQRGDMLLVERVSERGRDNFYIRGNLTKQKIISDATNEILKDFTPKEIEYIFTKTTPQR
jgi:hypothetical protein